MTANTFTVGVGHKGRLAVSGTAQVAASTLTVGGEYGRQRGVTQSGGTITASDVLMCFQAGTAALFSHTGGTFDTIRLQLGGGSTTPRLPSTTRSTPTAARSVTMWRSCAWCPSRA